ncbi:uncharacterized protein A4U43_C01F6310 [Asparagus officinalis]|uniref:CCT domain-containing protein n=2 Tax=Asparagus officinalis TaxID=4686 RepID=A0A5P1FMT8_ASPOF|nr:uncharacterized protein A4U43_C01F6310 [Asparagus officinalis]
MSILSTGGRTYGFDLDIIKSPASSSGRSPSSSPSSTISEASNSPIAISTKRARAPRKRPNQSYTEAAALLSTIYPNLFSTKNLHKLSKHSKPFSSLPPSLLSSSDLLPPFPVINEAGFLIQDQSPCQSPRISFGFKPASPSEKSCIEYQEPSSPESTDYDVESILDEEVGEGIDSILGSLSVEKYESNSNSYVNPHIASLMGVGIGGKAKFGFGLRFGRNDIRQALRGAHNSEWWRPTIAVPVGDIVPVPKFSALPSLEKKKKSKKKKKVEKEEVKDEPKALTAETKATSEQDTCNSSLEVELKSAGLGLKLNTEDVLKDWSDREFPFASESGTPESSADIHARLAEIDLSPENEGGVREASVQRYREKRRTRLFSKKIRLSGPEG